MSMSTPPPAKGGKASRKAVAAGLCTGALAPATFAGLAVQLDLPLWDFFFSRALGAGEVATIVATLAVALFWPESQNK